jgi:phosphohistidine swiveling domain-containing protein
VAVVDSTITARELGIPCIVGTKIATQVLRDGDLVEVDAEKGIVTILERVVDVDVVKPMGSENKH